MARAARIWPNVYFGRPGSLFTLPYPRGDISKPYDRLTFDFITGSGQHSVLSMAQGSRPYTMTWNSFHGDTFATLDQFWTGQMGVGPWVFIDPSANNLLLPNQASATNNLMDTTGFATSTGAANMGTLISNSSGTFIHRTAATRSLRWQFTVGAATSPQLNIGAPYRNWFGIPVAPNLGYNFSVWARPDGVVDASITMAAKVDWLDAAGSVLSTYSSGDIVMTGWTKLHTSLIGPGAIAPSNAVYARPNLVATGATITTGASIYADELMFEQDLIANNWSPGTGVRAVEMLSLDDNVPFDVKWKKGIAMTLRELAV